MHYIPKDYAQLNLIEGTRLPSVVKNVNNVTFMFWERSLFQRAASVIKAKIPASWEGSVRDFLYYVLFASGHCAVFYRPEYGTIFQPCGLSGRDIYYQPTRAIISNPAFKQSLDLQIGSECEILKLTPDYSGVWDIISYYAEKLSMLDNAINMSIINGKFAFMLGARNKAAGAAIKKMLDKINSGEPAVVYDMKLLNDPTDKAEPWQLLDLGDIKNKYLTTMQLQDFQTLLNNFDAEIGIPTVPYAKKERMVTDEAQSRIIDATSRSQVWIDCLKSSCKKINALYPDLNLDFELRYPQEGAEDGAGNDNADRTV